MGAAVCPEKPPCLQEHWGFVVKTGLSGALVLPMLAGCMMCRRALVGERSQAVLDISDRPDKRSESHSSFAYH